MPVVTTTTKRLQKTVDSAGLLEGRLTWLERGLLAVAVLEIPLGVDKYLQYSETDGNLGAVAGFSVSLASLCLVGLYLLWFMGFGLRRMDPQRTIWGVPQLLYLAAVALSVLAAEVRHLALCDLFLLCQAYAIFFYVANRIRQVSDLTFLIGCVAIGMGLQGLIMILQRAMGPSIYGQTIQVSMIKFIVGEDGRTAGTLHSAVLAGSWLAILWLVSLPVFIVQRRGLLSWGLGVCLGLGLLGMLFTQTRGAVVTVAVGAAVLGGLLLSRGWLPGWVVKLALLGSLLAVIPLVQMIQNRVLQGDRGSAESRVHLTAIALETIPHSPVFGHGAGNCHLACMPAANSAKFRSEWYFTVHSKYLIVLVETGIVGLVTFCLVLLNGVRQGIITWSKRHLILSPLGLGCAAAILGHSVHMFVDVFNSRPQVQTLWLVLGITALTYRLVLATARSPIPGQGEFQTPVPSVSLARARSRTISRPHRLSGQEGLS